MKQEVKILLYPEEHKSKNGAFFENLMRIIFEKDGYELEQNINFTGLEIDLLGNHKRRNETLLVECKAKQKPQSTEIKNFAYNLFISEKADYGYFVYTEELDHQAAGVASELVKDENRKKKATFLGPKEIIDILTEINKIKPHSEISLSKDNNICVYKLILAYTYFGVFYIFIASPNASNKNYYLYDANTLDEIQNISDIADQDHSSSITIEQALKNGISDIEKLKHIVYDNVDNKNNATDSISLSEKFEEELEDMGVSFIHSKADEIKLSDIFVAPNLMELSLNSSRDNKQREIKSLWDILDNHSKNEEIRFVIIGSETSGKTSICKQIFDKLYNKGFIPVLLNGDEIKNSREDNFNAYVLKVFNRQYHSYDFGIIEKDKIILIIDDFHKFKKSNHKNNEDCRDILVKNISKKYKNMIFIFDAFMPLEVITKNEKIKYLFDKYHIYRILEFGSKLRHELVEKWHNIGNDINFSDPNDTFKKYDEVERQIEIIIGKNYIPSYPFYILTLLQASEHGVSRQQNYSLHGFYYEYLINQQLLEAVHNKEDISLYYNYITELCFYLFENKKNSLVFNEFNRFHSDYCQKYSIDIDHEKILKNLSDAKLLDIDDCSLRIHYKYVYYFFVAKYLTNNVSDQNIKIIISKMCQRVYREEYSNVIMFLTHLSKEPYIIDEILKNAKLIFKDIPIAEINHDMDDINQLIKEMPKQVIELVNVKESREQQLQEKEEIEVLQNNSEGSSENQSLSLDENIDDLNFMAKFTLALKTIDILGQLAKKYWGEMTGEQKYNIVSETYFLGLRTLKYYLNLVHEHKDLIASLVKDLINRKHIKDNFSIESGIESTASEYIFRLCFLSSFGLIKRITHAVGYEKLSSIFKDILENNPVNSVKLINLSIKLDCYKIDKIPIDEIKDLKLVLDKNILGTLVLRNLIIDYMYMFNTEYDERQQISNLFGIEIQKQRQISFNSKTKKE